MSGGEVKSDEGTRLSDRVTIGRDFSLTISPVAVEDQLPFYCQVTAGPAGVGEAITQLKVFCELLTTDLESDPTVTFRVTLL